MSLSYATCPVQNGASPYTLVPSIQAVLQLIAALIYMFSANALLAAASLLFIPIWFFLLRGENSTLASLRQQILNAGDKAKGIVIEALSFTGLQRVKSFNAFDFDAARFINTTALLRSLNMRWIRAMAIDVAPFIWPVETVSFGSDVL